MNLDEDKIDDVVLALLQLTAHGDGLATRAWKSQSWEVMDRLHQKGFISDPKGNAKSVVFTEEGLLRSRFLFEHIFGSDEETKEKVKSKSAEPAVLHLRVALRDSNPEIWREFHVPDDLTLGELHVVLQVVMGWYDCHLHQFLHKKKCYGVPSDDDWREVINEDSIRISDIFLRKGSRIEYEYDFGDGWIHDIVSLGKADPGTPVFRVSGGAMACPPEDCGGIWGYYELLEALADPGHPEHETYRNWCGDLPDPKVFDRASVNKRLDSLVKQAASRQR